MSRSLVASPELALVAAYLVAAPSAVNPAAPEEAAAADSCTGSTSHAAGSLTTSI